LLGDVFVCRQGHDQDVAERCGLLEMEHMAHVHEVERAVAEDDRLVAQPLAEGRKIGNAQDLPGARPLSLQQRRVGRIARSARIKHAYASRPSSTAQSTFNVRNTSTKFLRRNALLSPFSRSIRSMGTSMTVLVRRRLLTSTSD